MPSKVATVSRGMILVGTMMLTGCLALPGSSPSIKERDVSVSTRSIDLLNRARQREKVKLVQGGVVVRAPAGYCAERSSRVENDFVLLGDCNVLRKVESRLEPYERGLLTVSAGPVNSVAPDMSSLVDGLEAFGDPRRRGRLATVRIEEGGDRLVPGADPVYWRGVMVVNNRVVSLAAFGPPYSDMAHEKGRDLLTELAANILAETPAVDPSEILVANAAQTESSENQNGSVFDFFGRMLQKN